MFDVFLATNNFSLKYFLFFNSTRLEEAQKEQRIIADDKQNLEKKLKDEIKMAKVMLLYLNRYLLGIHDHNTDD